MAKTAFLFPGQGSQTPGMAADLYTAFPEARERLDAANDVLGFRLTDLLFGNDAEALRQTDITQPALYVHSLAAMAVAEARTNLTPDMAAGHSLGEYSALAAVGALSFEDGLRLVRLRGQLMARAGTLRPGTMAALIGASDEDAERLCATLREEGAGVIQTANFNSPGQVVISGEVAAIDLAVERAKGFGAKRALKLPVSGAFHSPLMEDARAELGEALAKATISIPRCPVYLNVTAEAATDPETIRALLLAQLTAPVRWTQILHNMHRDGAMHFVEVGTGSVLSGLVKRTLPKDVETRTLGTAAEFSL